MGKLPSEELINLFLVEFVRAALQLFVLTNNHIGHLQFNKNVDQFCSFLEDLKENFGDVFPILHTKRSTRGMLDALRSMRAIQPSGDNFEVVVTLEDQRKLPGKLKAAFSEDPEVMRRFEELVGNFEQLLVHPKNRDSLIRRKGMGALIRQK